MKSFNEFLKELIPLCSKCGDFMEDFNVGDEDLVCKSCERQEKLDDLLDKKDK